ncbi:nucleic acid-binding protein [Patellaria atrata CBS 101060]|uniref:rRNA biogenesis protein RRP5 n=1 Tax=Patellaria atrata CBS 101060 TaxID=1346257 RepID=A0A9P4VQU6_9PEZI|nr:nucleic acid-binding protein [Patellaria atrata CBS 101060]
MAPIKRQANAASKSELKHSGEERPSKRQRKDEKENKGVKLTPVNGAPEQDSKRGKPITASILLKEETSFPRGGASVLTPLEHKQIQIEATRDVLFEQSGQKRQVKDADSADEQENGTEVTKSALKKRKKAKDRKGSTTQEDEEPEVRIEGLSYKRITPGSIILGQITQISANDISLALPNNLTGFIPLTNVSDQLTNRIEKLLAEDEDVDDNEDDDEDEDGSEKDIVLKDVFKIGQYLRAYVKSTSDESTPTGSARSKKRIELSVNPREANTGLSISDLVDNSMVQASVISVEDHGLIMDLGLDDGSVRGFMSSRELGQNVDHSKVQEGSVFLCLVTGKTPKTVKLSADHGKAGIIKKSHYISDAPSINIFLPGTAVELLVTQSTPAGIAGQLMGMLDVTADFVHCGAGHTLKDISTKYKVGSKAKARIVCTFPTSEKLKLGVSFLEHVLSLSPRLTLDDSTEKDPLSILPLSSIIEEAKVKKVEPGMALFMDIGLKGFSGYAHISRLSDTKVETISATEGRYKFDSIHRARVVGYNPVDGLYILSLQQSILDQPFLRIEDLKVGQAVKGKVEKLIINEQGVSGILVNLAEGITGLVPDVHMADIRLQHPEKKFREGVSVHARVLSLNPEKKQIRLTLKKTLVASEAGIWTDYNSISVGDEALGTLVKILDTGAIVQFYGDIRAFLPVSEMSEAFIDPKVHFRQGQTVNTHVLAVDLQEKRMTVSCRDPTIFTDNQQKAYDEIAVGDLINGTVSEKLTDTITIELLDSTIKGTLRLGHLTDGSAQKNLSSMKKIRDGQTLQDLVVIQKLDKRHMIVLSNKPSLVKAAKTSSLVTKFGDLEIGKDLKGWIRNIDAQRIFIECPGGLVGVVFRSHIPPEMLESPNFSLQKEQSIIAKIISIDPNQQRFCLSLKKESEASTKAGSNAPSEADVLINPVDGVSRSIYDFTLGKTTKARINSVKSTQLNVSLADKVYGRIDMSEAFDDWEEIRDKKHPLRSYKAGQIIDVKVLGIHHARTHRFLPISHRQGKIPVFELSAKKKTTLSDGSDILTLDKVEVGSSWIAYVNNISGSRLWVNISPNVHGRMEKMAMTDDLTKLSNLSEHFPIGSALKVRAKNVDVATGRLDLVATSVTSATPWSWESVAAGMVIPARVSRVTQHDILVKLSDTVYGPVGLTELDDDYNAVNPLKYRKGQIVRVCVLSVDAENKKIEFSMRPSKVLSSSLPVKDPQILSLEQIKVNDVVRGFVQRLPEKMEGILVALGNKVIAFVKTAELSDSYIKDWRPEFPVDKLVTGKVVSVDPASKQCQMSLKASVVDKDYVAPLMFHDFKAGQIVTGKVRKVEEYGVFIVVDNSSNVSGLCHQSQIADHKVGDVTKLYSEGDAVKAKVLKVDEEKRRINFGLKASYFRGSAADSESEDDDQTDGVILEDSDNDSDVDMDGGVDLTNVKDINFNEDNEEEAEGLTEEMEVGEVPFKKPVHGLSTSGFDWTGDSLARDDPDAASNSDASSTQDKKKRRRKTLIQVDKTGDLDRYGPQSVDDFERLLLARGNSSELWMQYMAFQLGLSEVDKARTIAERALNTINITEEEEKRNIWVAWLNLEVTFGTDESLEEVFKRACQYNDPGTMHEHLASIYIDAGIRNSSSGTGLSNPYFRKAEDLYSTMLRIKSLTATPSFWINYATFLLTTLNDPARAHSLLKRATQSVPEHLHTHLTSKFGALEFQSPNGDPERGRTIFEGLVDAFSKRGDLWDVFVDLEKGELKRGKGSVEAVRGLYERMTKRKMKSKRARGVFEKWAEWEEEIGDAKKAEKVRARGKEYFEGLKKKTD